MKLILYDFTNYGLVHIDETGTQVWEMDLLRNCILDTNVATVRKQSPVYDEINNNSIRVSRQNKKLYFFFQNKTDQGVFLGSYESDNDYYWKKQELAAIRYPIIQRVCSALRQRTLVNINHFGEPIESTLYSILEQSNEASEEWSSGIIEYAKILNITPRQAFNEIMIDYKTQRDYRFRAYATAKKYEKEIRQVYTKEDANNLLDEINQKLFRDTFI